MAPFCRPSWLSDVRQNPYWNLNERLVEAIHIWNLEEFWLKMTELEWTRTDRQTDGQAENNRAPPTFVGGALIRLRLARWNWFKPSSKIFYWAFQGGTSFVDHLCFCSVLCLLCLCARLFICALWSPAGKGLTSWLSFVMSTVSLSLSHWYPGSGVVLDCIDSWSLHPYLLSLIV